MTTLTSGMPPQGDELVRRLEKVEWRLARAERRWSLLRQLLGLPVLLALTAVAIAAFFQTMPEFAWLSDADAARWAALGSLLLIVPLLWLAIDARRDARRMRFLTERRETETPDSLA